MNKQQNARDGAIWVCGACGKTEHDRYRFRDVSCFMNSVECVKDSLMFDENHRVTFAYAVDA